MKFILLSFFILVSINASAEVSNEAEYHANSETLDKQIKATMDVPSRFFISATTFYSEKSYTKAKKDVIDSFDGAHKSLQKKWGGDQKSKNKTVPDQFVKKLIEGGMTKQSFDSMVMSVSGINGIDSCSLVEVQKPKAGTLEKLAVGPNKHAQDYAFGVEGKANGYVEPFSHHFFKAASAIYFLGLAVYQEQYLQKSEWIKEYSQKIDGSTQKHSLKVNIELTKVAKDYIKNQVELKKTYKQMIGTAARIAETEMMSKANRKSYRGNEKGKAKKDYKKKKKRAHISDHAARDAVKSYGKFLQKKYEYDQSTVHTHISCGTLFQEEQVSVPRGIHLQDFINILFPTAMAEEEVPISKEKAQFDYYLEFSKKQNEATNEMMRTPENRVKFFSESTIKTLDKDIANSGESYTTLSTNLSEVEGIYDKFLADGGDELKDSTQRKMDAGTNAGITKGIGTSLLSVSEGVGTEAVNVVTRGGELSDSESLRAVAAKIRDYNEKIKPSDFVSADGDKTVLAKSYLEDPSKYSLEDIKKNALKNLSDVQKKHLASSFRSGVKADDVSPTEEISKKSEVEKKVAVKKRSKINLPDIDDDPALKLLRKSRKMPEKKLLGNEDEELASEESLAKIRNGSATDINDDRETTIWVIISNRYVRTGFKKLLELK